MPGVTSVREITSAVERLAPPDLAEGWDNSGLQVGAPAAGVGRVLVALTPLPEVFDEAEETGADFLLLHHPLIFSPLKSVETGSYPGDLVARAISGDLTVYAAHTSYDAAPDGVSSALAAAVGLRGPLEVVSPRGACASWPSSCRWRTRRRWPRRSPGPGAGRIGDYTRCTFRSPGTGTFLPGEGSDPYLGERGRLERVDEVRLETVVPAHLARAAVDAATAAHPYEEVALDVYPVEGVPEVAATAGSAPSPSR
jgi:putative NIF3 family GTP cyclohydrolase 1 type 2